MRTLRLARIAAEAEGLRLRRQAQRMVVRLVLGLIALAFLGMAVACLHVFIWFAFRLWAGWTTPWSAAIMVAFDMVMAAVFAMIAASSRPGQVELEALEVRRRALESATRGVALTGLLVPCIRIATDLLRKRRS